jgi:hypothetical protein
MCDVCVYDCTMRTLHRSASPFCSIIRSRAEEGSVNIIQALNVELYSPVGIIQVLIGAFTKDKEYLLVQVQVLCTQYPYSGFHFDPQSASTGRAAVS